MDLDSKLREMGLHKKQLPFPVRILLANGCQTIIPDSPDLDMSEEQLRGFFYRIYSTNPELSKEILVYKNGEVFMTESCHEFIWPELEREELDLIILCTSEVEQILIEGDWLGQEDGRFKRIT